MRLSGLGMSVLALTTVSCTADRRLEQHQEYVVRDSAGTRVVEYQTDFASLHPTPQHVEHLIEIGAEGSGAELFRVTSARFLRDGRLAVGNSGSSEVFVFSGDGLLLERFGGRGEGPGEFGTVTSMHVEGDGAIAVFDDQHARLTLFGPGGEVLGTARLGDPSPVSDLLPLTGGYAGPILAVVRANRTFPGDGVRRDTAPLLRYNPQGTVADTVGHWATQIASYSRNPNGGWGRTAIAFGPDLLASGSRGLAALADTHRPRVVVYSADGSVGLDLRWLEEPREVTRTEYDTWWAEAQARTQSQLKEMPPDIRQAMLNRPRPPSHGTHPVLVGVALAANGELWIAPTNARGAASQRWFRFSAEGELLASIALPQDARILDISGARVATLQKSPLGVETVHVYGIEASPS